MNEISIPLETLANLADLEGHPLARHASPKKLYADLGARYEFLSRRVEVRLADATVTIRWAPETEEDQAQAARLCERAGRRAREGEYERVTALCRQALRLQPELREARRELVRAHLQTGDRASARIALRQALWLDPRDAWSLVTLADLLTEGGDADKAERLACLALELEPGNAEAIEALGRAQLLAEQAPEALGTFGRALLIKPQSTGARLGAARALLRRDQPDESLELLHGVFAEAGANRRITPAITEARDLYAQAQEVLARRDLDQIRQAVRDFRRRLEEEGGLPICFSEAEDHWAWIENGWTNSRPYHLVACASGLPEPLRLHLIAHELMHLQTDLEAHRAGRLRAADPAGSLPEFRGLCASAAHDLRRRGADAETIEGAIEEALQCCAGTIHGYPLDMVVEARLRAELPVLRPVQFLSQQHFMPMPDRLDLNPRLRRILSRSLLQAVEALNGAYYLSIDHLHHGATQFAARYQKRPTFGWMQELFAVFQARFPGLGPGGHFELVDEFAERLGLTGLCQWQYFPAKPVLAAGLEACAPG